jgi:hypothetical protein
MAVNAMRRRSRCISRFPDKKSVSWRTRDR